MSETTIIFTFNGTETKIQCSKNDYLKDFQRYSAKIKIDLSEIYFAYGGNIVNQEQKLSSLNNKDNCISILAYPFDFSSNNNNSLKKSKILYVQNVFKHAFLTLKIIKFLYLVLIKIIT